MALFVSSLLLVAQEKSAAPRAVNSFPDSDFTLRDKGLKPQKGGVLLGPMESDGKGGTKGSFAVYGGPSMIQVESLSFSGDGKILAVGSTPGRVDVWDVEKRTKLFSLEGGTTIALSPDGRLLAKEWKRNRDMRRGDGQTDQENSVVPHNLNSGRSVNDQEVGVQCCGKPVGSLLKWRK
jgi:hypothetical protein